MFGVFRAQTHGGNDFSVFYGAWRLVLEGHGSEIYHVSADRFLYAPGFAWLLCPLGILPRVFSLALWCLMKALVVGLLIKKLTDSNRSIALAAWGIILASRPLLIDIEYGQVNLFILGASVWALAGHFDRKPSVLWDSLRWSILAIAALAKLFPIPLLIVPWFVQRGVHPKKIKIEQSAIFFGVLVTLLVPVTSLGWFGGLHLLIEWKDALFARGLPLESHNQSFIALLHHYLSGSPTPVHSEGGGAIIFGRSILSLDQIRLFSLAWTLTTLGLTLGWIVSGSNHLSRKGAKKWTAIVIGLLIVPSHLIWKPYFVMSIPMATLAIESTVAARNRNSKSWVGWILILFLFAGINLTGFDFVGHLWAAHIEAASIFLMMHLALIGMVITGGTEDS